MTSADSTVVGSEVASVDTEPIGFRIESTVGHGGVDSVGVVQSPIDAETVLVDGSSGARATFPGAGMDATVSTVPIVSSVLPGVDSVADTAADPLLADPGAVGSPAAMHAGIAAAPVDSTPEDSVSQMPASARTSEPGSIGLSSTNGSQGSETLARTIPTEGARTESVATTTDSRQTQEVPGRIEVPDGRSPSKAQSRPAVQEYSNSFNDRRRSEALDQKQPAAVARAEKVNQALQDARSQSSSTASNPSAPSAVVSGAPQGSIRSVAPTAQTLPNHPAGPAPEAADEGRSRTMPGVGRGLETLARQRGGTLTMRLDPPSLGHLKLEMRMDAGRVTVMLTSASDSARSLLRDNLGSLRQALEDRGLAVDRLAVESASRTSEGSSNQRSENRGDGQDARGGQDAADRQDAGEGRSRGRRDDASDRRADREGDSQRPEVANFDEALVQATDSDN